MNANNVVQELWRLCTILRKDGILPLGLGFTAQT